MPNLTDDEKKMLEKVVTTYRKLDDEGKKNFNNVLDAAALFQRMNGGENG